MMYSPEPRKGWRQRAGQAAQRDDATEGARGGRRVDERMGRKCLSQRNPQAAPADAGEAPGWAQ